MRVELTEVIWLEEHVLSFAELAELSGLQRGLLEELVQSGTIAAIDQDVDGRVDAGPGGHEAHYGAAALAAARHARQLQEDFELDAAALVLVLGLCERVSELEAQLRELQAKLPRPLR